MLNNVIVTGATGAIGRALVEYLLSKEIGVTIVVRKLPSNYLKHKNLKVVNCELSGYKDLDISEKFDVFFHLAWSGTYGDERNNPKLQNNNVNFTLDAVKLAKRLGCQTFVGVGSQAEYGSFENGTKLSPNTKTNPITEYGKAKLKACISAKELCKEIGIRFNWCRVLSTYGVGDKPYTLVMSTVSKLLNGEKCDFTKCDQEWDYIYNKDIARGLYCISQSGSNGKIYTIGNGKTQPLKEYIITIQKIIGVSDNLLNFGAIPYFENQVMYLCADISELTKDTGFVPQYTFEEGIKETVEWYKLKENL